MINFPKMRFFVDSLIVIVLSMTLIFLGTAPQKSSASPTAIVSSAIMVLGPFIEGYLGDLRTRRESEKIETRVWMHTGDPNMNGCGFYFEATGYSGKVVKDWFPSYTPHKCGKDTYLMRMTSQSAMYSEKLRLGNDQVKEVQVHADGWRDTFVKMMCFGFNERTIAGGPRALCIDNDLLKGCQAVTNKWNDITLNSDNLIKLTRTTRGIHQIKFTDIEQLINGFEALAGNPDDVDAVKKVCDRIELVRGGFSSSYQDCRAEKSVTVASGAGMFYSWRTTYTAEDKNPDGCDRYTD